ncbi:MAG: DUF6046 domain-containing protein [Microscillaceae bacterium]|nr:DUF6046 domain-containing protein [Microscillaceae bacterium]
MAELEVRLRERILSSFRVAGKRYLLPDSKTLERQRAILGEQSYKPDSSQITVFQRDVVPASSVFGTPLFDSIRILGDGVDYTFQHDPLVDFTRTKKITETVLNDGNSVIEVAGVQPIDIRIQGVLWNPSGGFPDEELSELIRIFEEDTTLDVVSRLFNYHQVTSIYIKSLDTPALEGFEDTQPFVISARSIKPASLVILENNL